MNEEIKTTAPAEDEHGTIAEVIFKFWDEIFKFFKYIFFDVFMGIDP